MSFLSWLGQLQRLIAPVAQQCLSCSNRTSSFSPLQGVCTPCYAGIPWISKPRCVHCGRGTGCPDCTRATREERYFILNRSAVSYDAHMREMLAQYKYRGDERYAQVLTPMLVRAYQALQRELSQAVNKSIQGSMLEQGSMTLRDQARSQFQYKGSKAAWRPDLITCIPVSQARLQERGFNQAEVLGRGAAEAVGVPFAQLLNRQRHTDKQSFKSRNARMANMSGAFQCSSTAPDVIELMRRQRAAALQGEPLRIVIVDDIYTTGSTMNAAAYNLRLLAQQTGQSIEVVSLTWARS